MVKKLDLTDNEANQLILLLKKFAKNYGVQEIMPGSVGSFEIIAKKSSRKFWLDYMYQIANIHLNFRDSRTNLTLVRINLDNSFHKNSDNTIIRGNRIEIFSEKEYYAKQDYRTHIKAYPLPFKDIQNTDDFFDAFQDILNYTNTAIDNNIIVQSSII